VRHAKSVRGERGKGSSGTLNHDRPKGLRLLLLTQYYYPEVGAAQTRLRETVKGLADRGFEITVVAPAPSYPTGIVPDGYAALTASRERIDGVPVIRLPAAILPGAGMSRRLVGHATFAGSSVATMALARRHDVALIESPPLFLGLTARGLRAAGLPYVFHVADPWPDFPIALGYLRSDVERKLAFALEDLAYRGAAAVTTVSPGLVALLEAKGSAAGKVHLVPNGVDISRFDPSISPEAARDALGWAAAFTVVYAGTVGLAQGVGTLLDAAVLVGDGIRFHIVGEGVEKPMLEARARDMALSNVSFHRPIPRHDVPLVLAAADAGLVLLRRGPLYEDSLPTKLVESMAAGRPVIVSAEGLAARIIESSGGGYTATAEDPAALARAIEACRNDRDRAGRGRAARACAAQDYERGAVLDRLETILRGAARAS
jgi:colanic acid biosynthesis glycosyl transferase WcaI